MNVVADEGLILTHQANTKKGFEQGLRTKCFDQFINLRITSLECVADEGLILTPLD